MDYKKLEKIVNKYKYPKIKIKRIKGFSTRAIRVFQDPNPLTGALVTPINLSSTYCQKTPTELYDRYDYGRGQNPTRTVLEKKLAALEFGKYGVCTSSGLAANTAVLLMVKSGEHIIAVDDVYGGTQRYMRDVAEARHGIEMTFADMRNADDIIDLIQDNTKLIFLETPTNPSLKSGDIKAIAKIAKKKNILLAVDNTFMTPLLQSPLKLGADMCINSCTKFIGGHGDLIMGSITTNNEELYEELRWNVNTFGGCPSAIDTYLAIRGLQTLEVRVRKQCENALTIARYLEDHPKVLKCTYPGLESYEQQDIVNKQMNGPGSMITFYIDGDFEGTERLLSSFRVFQLAVSLGCTNSLIQAPGVMTHGGLPLEIRQKLKIDDNMVRISAGIENIEDLIGDLEQAFKNL